MRRSRTETDRRTCGRCYLLLITVPTTWGSWYGLGSAFSTRLLFARQLSRQFSLLRQPDTPQEVCKAQVGAQAVPSWFHPEPLHLKRMLFVTLFEPGKGFVLLTQARVDEGYAGSGHIFLCGKLLELVKLRSRLVPLT